MNKETEDVLRLRHMIDEIRELDFYVVRGEWGKAFYHCETISNLLIAELLKIELEEMRAEREETNVIQIKH